jgi:hypothetical protein
VHARKSHARLMTFLNTREINSMLDYDMLDIGTLDITASPNITLSVDTLSYTECCTYHIMILIDY